MAQFFNSSSSSLLTVLNLLTMVAMVVVGFVTYKAGMNKAAQEISDRVLAALKEENLVLQNRVDRMETVLKLIVDIFAKRNIHIQIDGETVQIVDRSGTSYSRPSVKRRPQHKTPAPPPSSTNIP